ncbi:MAG TPA: metalloregulator ArsR/SmtB family transcription factor [Deltaproteobacteria bacterium]|mgnify:CR=1 FL=1|nr:metalloregulator ArsR/SmtB family transcription factor [Deltaproteobacteria bacterium]HPJ92698.1 metalloregulator ArsR/SmtB family transcription factor [Deltaproteobacteria bacterium]HPR50535.1 metalloregulator ArsR/SmtB family transcription factor [Deltaproteobacteria bacterium]
MTDPYQVDSAIHAETVNNVRKLMPDNDRVLNELADFFKLFGDPTRIKILFALGAAELCVGDIASLLNMNHSAVSHQLRTLRRARLIKSRKEGKLVFYSLNDRHIKHVLAQGFEHINE